MRNANEVAGTCGGKLKFVRKNAFIIDQDAAIKIVQEEPWLFRYFSAILRADPNVVQAAASIDPHALLYVCGKLKANPFFMILLIKENYHCFQYADDALKRDHSFVMEAVTINENIFQYVCDALKNDLWFTHKCIVSIPLSLMKALTPENEDLICLFYATMEERVFMTPEASLYPRLTKDYEFRSKAALTTCVLIGFSNRVVYIDNTRTWNYKRLKEEIQRSEGIPFDHMSLLMERGIPVYFRRLTTSLPARPVSTRSARNYNSWIEGTKHLPFLRASYRYFSVSDLRMHSRSGNSLTRPITSWRRLPCSSEALFWLGITPKRLSGTCAAYCIPRKLTQRRFGDRRASERLASHDVHRTRLLCHLALQHRLNCTGSDTSIRTSDA